MDFVDEVRGDFVKREQLELTHTQSKLMTRIENLFQGHRLLYLPLNRGLSGATKIIIKPMSLFPFLVKLTSISEATAEKRGYDLFKVRVPPTNIPPLEGFFEEEDEAALLYRYVTGGRVSNPIGRLDIAIGSGVNGYSPLLFIELFDVVLKKPHWADGNVKIGDMKLPPLPEPEAGIDNSVWDEIASRYNTYVATLNGCRAPFGLVHGDLHPKNILITRTGDPILIDFALVTDNDCLYRDYAKVDSHLQFQVAKSVSDPFWKISKRVYTRGELILPRSNRELASCIMAIRGTLWKTCLSTTVGLDPDEIDHGYAGQLLYYLVRMCSKAGASSETKSHALNEIRALTLRSSGTAQKRAAP